MLEKMHKQSRTERWVEFGWVRWSMSVFIVLCGWWDFIELLDINKFVLIELEPDELDALESPERDPRPPALSKCFVFFVEKVEELLVVVDIAYVWLSELDYLCTGSVIVAEEEVEYFSRCVSWISSSPPFGVVSEFGVDESRLFTFL